MRCLADPFRIITDHKNLEVFTRARSKPLNERQVRWQEKLSRHRYRIQYRPGSQQILADALSRRDQDIPQGEEDERIDSCRRILIPPELIVYPAEISSRTLFEDEELENLWQRALAEDKGYQEIKDAVDQGDWKLPKSVKQVQISECRIDSDDKIMRYRDRVWIPAFEPLQTRLYRKLMIRL